MPTFEIGEESFLLDGRPHRIISGALHYFRVHPDLWADRLHQAKLMGLNTIETYVAWNAHSPQRGMFETGGGLDLGRFLDLVAAEGMHAIVRPGPYICAEWTSGGLPTWLFELPGVRLRRMNEPYLSAVGEFLDALLPIVAARQITNGGPVIAVQVENEYGAYGSDTEYLATLRDMMAERGIEVPFFTCDQADPTMLQHGRLPGVLQTLTFGSRAAERFALLREHQPSGPLMCAEFWLGWFDSWGEHHHTTPVADAARELDAILAAGASVNLYMFHGGTNLGLTNGANDKGTYWPITTSYDYDAPLSEDGKATAKFAAFREVIARYAPVPAEEPAVRKPAPHFDVALTGKADLVEAFGALAGSDHHTAPMFEDISGAVDIVLYETQVNDDDAVLVVDEIRDRAVVLVDGRPIGTIDRSRAETTLTLPGVAGTLQLLVEDQGRVNYGQRLGERKGLIGAVRTDRRDLTGWHVRGWDSKQRSHVDALLAGVRDAAAPWDPASAVGGPVLLRGTFETEPGADHFLSTRGWGTGIVWVNGTLLGRYWSAGPTRTLYVPGPVLRAGSNELVVAELRGMGRAVASFVSEPELGHTER